ncbi:MAG: ribosomal protein S18-alanine N-acetyltransferase [Acidimicrobiia bacterium]
MAAEPADLGLPPEPADVLVHITAMRRRHLRGVLRIEQEVYPRPWSIGLFMSELAMRSGRIYLVARVGLHVVGYVGLMMVGTDGHVTTVAVDPEWHRFKVGTRLLVNLCRRAIDGGADALTLEVRMSNEPAQALYRQFGFAPAGIRKNYYVETGEDALIMWAHDVQAPEYRRRLDTLEAGIPGATVLEDF